MALALATELSYGFITVMANPTMTRSTVALAERFDYDSIWVGDHVEFPVPILDPLLQIAQAAGMTDKLTFGTGVYLLPMRHVVHVAKQLTSLDQLTGGRLIFGAGVGGEFANEWAATGVPHKERGARMSESIPVLKELLTGATCSNDGQYYPFENVTMKPACTTPNGPPIWTGGRSAPALARAGKMADGWFSYVVTPEMYRNALQEIEKSVEATGRDLDSFGSGHLLFMRVDNSHEQALEHATEHLSMRYAMDFREAAKKYCALGSPADVAERVNDYVESGCRHFVLDLTGPFQDRDEQIERFAKEVKPLLSL